MTITLKAERRQRLGKLDTLRKSGVFPAVYYGHKQESLPIQMKHADFLKVWKEAGESTVVSIDGLDGKVDALIHSVDFDPVSGEPIHADFYVFEKGHKLEVDVPLEFVGVSGAVKELGAVLVKVMHELKIKADPANLPHQIEVDISSLEALDSHINAGSIKLPAGVELMDNPEDVVVSAATPKEEKEEEAAPIDLTSIEVEKKGKVEDEETTPEAPSQ